jgi:hypothetical protein
MRHVFINDQLRFILNPLKYVKFANKNRPEHAYYGNWQGVAEYSNKNVLQPAPVTAYWRMCNQVWTPEKGASPALVKAVFGWVRVLYRSVDKKHYESTGGIRIDYCLIEQYPSHMPWSHNEKPISRGFVPVSILTRFAVCVVDVDSDLVAGDVVTIIDKSENSCDRLTVKKHSGDSTEYAAPAWHFGPAPID